MFHALESSLREMRELQRGNPQAEDTQFIEPGEEEEMDNEDNEDNVASEETKKERQEKMKKMLADSTRIHLLLGQSYYKNHLARNSNIRFENTTHDDNCSSDDE